MKGMANIQVPFHQQKSVSRHPGMERRHPKVRVCCFSNRPSLGHWISFAKTTIKGGTWPNSDALRQQHMILQLMLLQGLLLEGSVPNVPIISGWFSNHSFFGGHISHIPSFGICSRSSTHSQHGPPTAPLRIPQCTSPLMAPVRQACAPVVTPGMPTRAAERTESAQEVGMIHLGHRNGC